jgi:hypothetical protein
MVRSRSETNLNKIFLDLCTNPAIRSTCGLSRNNQRQFNPPLPTLKPIKSNSCSDLTKIVQDDTQPSLTKETETDTLDLTIPQQCSPLASKESNKCSSSSPSIPTESNKCSGSSPLIPTESTGFTVQTTSVLFETTLINSTELPQKRFSSFQTRSFSTQNSFSNDQKSGTTSLITTPSNDRKQQDYTNRLRDRLKARGHLRKFFLS